MSLSSPLRTAICLLFPFAAAPALALAPEAPLTADRAIDIQKDSVREAIGTLPCRRDGAGGDIVVCGRRGPNPNRVPFPDQRTPGEPENLLPGELPRAQSTFSTCEFGCPQPVTITDKDVRKYGGRIVRRILGKDD
ncbi:MAG TPA: hypothetical protein VF645_10885 [Allosphingosinicella sp.]|jgi:hypothetical protein